MKNTAIIVAAGSGKRIGGKTPKQFQEIAGKSVLFHTLDKFEASQLVDDILIVTSASHTEFIEQETAGHYSKITSVVEGGAERQHSVFAGLQAVDKKTDVVLIHDAVRPFVTIAKIEETITACRQGGAAVLAVPARDTTKTVRDGFILKTLVRKEIFLVQTPQTFKYDLILEAYEKAFEAGILETDDSALVERLGYKVKIVESDYNNFKITVPQDLVIANLLLNHECN